MRIELIATGDELLTGDITDTNASWLAAQLLAQGLKLSYKTTVADDLDELCATFLHRSQYADFIIVNGGLGPTIDDLSAQAAAKALGEPVVLFDSWVEQMKQKFAAMKRTMHDSNLKQAMLPESSEIIDNPVGTACGFKVVINGCTLVFTPGVPREFKHMVNEQIQPMLASLCPEASLTVKRYLCLGIGESALAQLLEPVRLPQGCEFGYRAAMPYIELKVFAPGTAEISNQLSAIATLISNYCVVENGNSLSRHVHELLLQQAKSCDHQYQFATVESCTGGMVASQLVYYPGSSNYLNRGLVTYSNQAKHELADVDNQAIDDFGAVSTEVAEQMAQGAVNKWGLDLAVSITGIAGPDGGSEYKPVGTVAFAIADKNSCVSQMLILPNRTRSHVRETAAAIALDMVRRYLLADDPVGEYRSFKRV